MRYYLVSPPRHCSPPPSPFPDPHPGTLSADPAQALLFWPVILILGTRAAALLHVRMSDHIPLRVEFEHQPTKGA